mgnify:CR=1 FL=1
MSYADLTYYKDTYIGTDPGDDTELQKYLNRATDDINIFCGNPIDTTDLHATQLDYLKKANSAQAEFYVINGDTYNTGTATNETIGRYSHSGGDPSAKSGMICQRARAYLSMVGRCNASAPVACRGAWINE